MKKVAIIPLVLGVVVGGLAIKFGLDTIQKAEAKGRVEMVTAVVAADDIPATSEIKEAMVTTVKTPVTPLLGRDSFQDLKDVVGRVAHAAIPRGAVVREALLAPVGTPSGLMVRIPKGFRAISLKINEVSAVGYQLRPGSVVDVIAVMKSGRRREMVSRIILQQIKVLAVGRTLTATSDLNAKPKAAKSVTLLVRDSDVPKLYLAQTNGKVTLAMRSPDDTLVSGSGLASESELLGIVEPVTPLDGRNTPIASRSILPQRPAPNYSVTVVDGKGRPMTVTFDGPNSTRQVMTGGSRNSGGVGSTTSWVRDSENDDGDEHDELPPPGRRKAMPG